MSDETRFLGEAIELARINIGQGGRPFGAVLVRDGAPAGLSTAAIYEDLARPFSEQSMTICYVPVRTEGKVDLYAEWTAARDKQE